MFYPQHLEAVGAVGVAFMLGELEAVAGGQAAHGAAAFEDLVVQLSNSAPTISLVFAADFQPFEVPAICAVTKTTGAC